MGAYVLVGCQHGDEGKGRVTDVLAEEADVVVRFQGGPNAGHTLNVEGEELILSSVPSGVLRPVVNVLGNGVYLDPIQLGRELEMLRDRGIKPNLKISSRAHLILPEYIQEDQTSEISRRIDTTRSGIGQTGSAKYARTGVRVGDLFNMFEDSVPNAREVREMLDRETLRILEQYVDDTVAYLHSKLDDDCLILGEGAQGFGLDIDHGTYPNVTSSSPTVGGFCTGTGIPPNKIEKVYGVVKAYATRVGSGSFPTELNDDIGNFLAKKGMEVGAKTGRDRRCGWLNLNLVQRACRVNGVTDLVVTKLDVLSGLEEVKLKFGDLLMGYDGWSEDISGVRSYDDLPRNAKHYLNDISDFLKTDITYVSVGPERDSIIHI